MNQRIKVYLLNLALLFITLCATNALRQSLHGLYTMHAEQSVMLWSWFVSVCAFLGHFTTNVSPPTAFGFWSLGSAYWYHLFLRRAFSVEEPLWLIICGAVYELMYEWQNARPYLSHSHIALYGS
jgi:hypothetical protein